MEPLYIDANAGLGAKPEALDAYCEATQWFANPSSTHPLGKMARQKLEEARQRLCCSLGGPSGRLVFTSGGTEANALALTGLCGGAEQPPHVISSTLEHASVINNLKRLQQRQQIDLTIVTASRSGRVCPDAIVKNLRPHTALVSIVAICNETGVFQPIDEIASLLRNHPANLHTDAVQAVGRIPVDVEAWGVDAISFSGHKFGSVSGVGGLWLRKGLGVKATLQGGGHEFGLRPGTENIAGALSMATALECSYRDNDFQPLGALRDLFESQLREETRIEAGIEIIGQGEGRLPNTSCVRFIDCEADAIMMALDLEGFAVSTGSACSSGSIDASPILVGMGLTTKEAKEALRFSLGPALREHSVRALSKTVCDIWHRIAAARSSS